MVNSSDGGMFTLFDLQMTISRAHMRSDHAFASFQPHPQYQPPAWLCGLDAVLVVSPSLQALQ
jgi:hypothetical protein